MLTQRRYLFGLVALLSVLAGVLVASRARHPAELAAVRLAVDLSERRLYVLEGGEVVKTYPVAVGRRSNPTPTGTFRTGRIEWDPDWTPPPREWAKGLKPRKAGDPRNPMQGVKIYFREPWYYIHGTNDPGSIGTAASRGCVRMRPADAIALAHRIENSGGSVPLVIRR
jgi:lipoprotein-anchoring transpeptidase ErfK/SrfK